MPELPKKRRRKGLAISKDDEDEDEDDEFLPSERQPQPLALYIM